MRDETTVEGATFATWVLRSRHAAGLTQEQVLDRALELAAGDEPELSKSTLNRWEGGKTALAKPSQLRMFCAITGADIREALVELGYVTREELSLPPASPPIDPALLPAAQLLANPDISVKAKDGLREMITNFTRFTYESLQVRQPRRATTAKESTERPPARR